MNSSEYLGNDAPTPLYDEERQLYDPTGAFREWPSDRNLLSWLKTAYFVKKASEASPDNPYLAEAAEAARDAILNRKSELKLAPPPER